MQASGAAGGLAVCPRIICLNHTTKSNSSGARLISAGAPEPILIAGSNHGFGHRRRSLARIKSVPSFKGAWMGSNEMSFLSTLRV